MSDSPVEPRQSRLGIASLITSLISVGMVIGVFPLMAILDASGSTEVPQPLQSLGAAFMPLAALFALLAIGTGIAGLFRRNRGRGLAVVGLIIGTCSLVLFIGIVVAVFFIATRIT